MSEIKVYDDLIDKETSKKVYEWGQNVSWYTGWHRMKHPKFKDISLFEYCPEEDGNFNNRHWLGEIEIPGMESLYLAELMRFSMYRRPIGWSTEQVRDTNPVIWDLWSKINEKVFDNKANIDGIPESILGLRGPNSIFKGGKTFFQKNDIEEGPSGWTCYLNARCADIHPQTQQLSRESEVGNLHKDTAKNWEGNYFTCIYISNLEWNPTWNGSFLYFDESETGVKHWKGNYNIGWPEKIVGNKPGRIIVYPHTQTHITNSPTNSAPEMTQRIVFRVEVNENTFS